VLARLLNDVRVAVRVFPLRPLFAVGPVVVLRAE
jgi:hypothetical protein